MRLKTAFLDETGSASKQPFPEVVLHVNITPAFATSKCRIPKKMNAGERRGAARNRRARHTGIKLRENRRRRRLRGVPVVDGGAGQDHGVVVGPLGRVAPALLVAVPEVAAGGVAYDSLRKTLPDGEGEVHLDRQIGSDYFLMPHPFISSFILGYY